MSRWLTAACRVLRLYLGTNDAALRPLCQYIVEVYFTIHMRAKLRWRVEEASVLFLEELKLIRDATYLTTAQRKALLKCMSHNAWPAHPHNVLLAMLCK